MKSSGKTKSKTPTKKDAGTLATQVYRYLRDDIITGRLAPGTRLVRRALAKRFDISVIPVLEALLRLENDGLVEYEENMGAKVAGITMDVLETHRVLREGMEIHMARIFAASAPKSAKESILGKAQAVDKFHKRMGSCNKTELRNGYRLHYDFHLAIPELAGYAGVAREMKSVWFKRIVFFSNLNMADTPPVEPHLHVLLAKGLTSGDPDLAAERMRLHLGYNREHYRLALNQFLSNKDETWRKEFFLIDDED